KVGDERDEPSYVRDLKRDDELVVADPEAVSGMDTDIRVVVPRGEVRAHDARPLLVRQRVPGPLLRHRIDDDVRRVPDRAGVGAAVLAPGVRVVREVRRAPPRGEVCVRACAVRPEPRPGETSLE